SKRPVLPLSRSAAFVRQTMQRLTHERGYTSFLFMIVDIINMQCTLLIIGGERAVAEVLKSPLQSGGHAIIVEGLVSRKKQLVPLLGRIQALLATERSPS
ncbi:MAG TPA: DHHA2 domain-containing protein, partial [Ktedonobacteraceae bacterium]|nr:DHHA2 domain-containing protein [Ktedonobacteraceae bacterium]